MHTAAATVQTSPDTASGLPRFAPRHFDLLMWLQKTPVLLPQHRWDLAQEEVVEERQNLIVREEVEGAPLSPRSMVRVVSVQSPDSRSFAMLAHNNFVLELNTAVSLGLDYNLERDTVQRRRPLEDSDSRQFHSEH